MFGLEVSAAEQHLFALPLRLGSLGICSPVSLAFCLYGSLVHCTEHLIKSIIRCESFELDSHFKCVSFHKANHQQQMSALISMMSFVNCFLYSIFKAMGYFVGQGQ